MIVRAWERIEPYYERWVCPVCARFRFNPWHVSFWWWGYCGR